MKIGEREKLTMHNDNLLSWATLEKTSRIKFGTSKYELGVILASKGYKNTMSFENKILELLKEGKEEHVKMWKDLCLEEQKYKAAESMQKAVESNINSIKFINRPIM